MDIMSPELFWIDDICYRLPALDISNSSMKQSFEQDEYIHKESKYFEEKDSCDDDISDLEESIEELPDNRYKLHLPIPQTFWSKIIGAKGVTKKRIESDTKTTIFIPRPMEHGDIIIKGSSKRSLILAKKNIDAIVLSSRKKLVFTHFISIPVVNQEIKKNFLLFKDQVLKLYGQDRGIDDSIFQKPEKLHLTICTLVLTDQNERNLAEKRLKEICANAFKPLFDSKKHCILQMKGIEYMNDDPAEVDVLYAKIHSKNDEQLLQRISNSILQNFISCKLIQSDNIEDVKLHVTLMNTIFRENELEEVNEDSDSFNKTKTKKTRKTFNAINILQNFQDFYFGEQELKSIHLSVRFSTGKDGYYKSSCEINL